MNTNETVAPTIDPMDQNVGDIDTSFPRLSANVYELEITAAEKVPNKAGTGENLKVSHKTTSAAVSTAGENLAAGVLITSNMSLTPTDRYPQTSIVKALALLMKSAGLTGTPRDLLNDPSQLVGKHVTAKVGVQKETAEFGESNKISSYLAKK